MLKVGIVGKDKCEQYIAATAAIQSFELVGVFDPSFQFETPKGFNECWIYYSFGELIDKCESLIFASAEKIYLPLIELAIKKSKPVFLHGVYNLSISEQNDILKLQEEARELVQVNQPIIYNKAFAEYKKVCSSILLLQISYANQAETKLLLQTRSIVSAVLSLYKSNVKKVRVNTIAACAEIPDIINIRIDFDNGSICEITTNAIESNKQFCVKSFEYGGYYQLDLLKNKLEGEKNNSKVLSRFAGEGSSYDNIIKSQIVDFYNNITSFKTPLNTLEHEIATQQIIEKVKEKLRININIF